MRYLIRYRRRLGDVIGCFPAARHLHRLGHEVWMETDPTYFDIFHCVDYVRWQNPYMPHERKYDRVLDLQIHDGIRGGARYHEFRKTKRHWIDFVYDHDDIRAAAKDRPFFTRTDFFDPRAYKLPADGEYALLAATGVSQQQKHRPGDVIALANRLYGEAYPKASLTPSPIMAPGYVYCRRLRDLPGLIAHPKHFLTINTGVNIVAAGVRASHHLIPQAGDAAQDNMNYGTAIEVQP
jgi:hypothetical protein